MKRLIGLAIVTGILGGLSPASAQVAWTFNSVSGPSNSLRGFQIDSPGGSSSDQYTTPYGFLFTLLGSPLWAYGMNKSVSSGTSSNDFFLQSYTVTNGQPVGPVLNVRSDTGQMAIGPGVSTNITQQQVNITAGTSTSPRTGIGVGVWGNSAGLYLYQNQTSPALKRTMISFNGAYLVGSDSAQNGTPDWWLWNGGTGHFVLTANTNDSLSVNYGATIAGTLQATGPFQHTGSTLGFYGATPQTKAVITGCRSDGTALANLLQKLQAMGLITDQTTP